MTRPIFKIIIPVYNTECYVGECLDSLLAQTYSNWEAICIDDGSTDNSGQILDRYAKRDSRISVIHQTNGGVSKARNAGLDKISPNKDTYVSFVDSDDYVSPVMYATIVEVVDKMRMNNMQPDYFRLYCQPTDKRYEETIIDAGINAKRIDYEIVDRGGVF